MNNGRVIVDVTEDDKAEFFFFGTRGRKESQTIMDIDFNPGVGLHLWVGDKKGTCYTISEEDVLELIKAHRDEFGEDGE